MLGPFRSALNPIGLMSADFVAREILKANWDLGLVIMTPNPLTYVLMPQHLEPLGLLRMVSRGA